MKFKIEDMGQMAVMLKSKNDTRDDYTVKTDAMSLLRSVADYNGVQGEARDEGFSFGIWNALKTAYANRTA